MKHRGVCIGKLDSTVICLVAGSRDPEELVGMRRPADGFGFVNDWGANSFAQMIGGRND